VDSTPAFYLEDPSVNFGPTTNHPDSFCGFANAMTLHYFHIVPSSLWINPTIQNYIILATESIIAL
jgi:hypothetical protein